MTTVLANIGFKLGHRYESADIKQLQAATIVFPMRYSFSGRPDTVCVRFFTIANRIFQSALASMYGCGFVEKSSTAASTCITMDSLKACTRFNLNSTVLRRMIDGISYGMQGSEHVISETLMFEDLVRLLFTIEDRMEHLSASIWFRALDLDDDGYLSRQDLETIYREKLDIQGVIAEKQRLRIFNNAAYSNGFQR